MKTSDLTIGTDYAYEAWKRAKPERVTVVATKVTGRDQSGFGGRGGERSGLVRVALTTGDSKGREFNVRPQTLTMTWAEYHAQQTAIGRAQAQRARQRQVETEANAALAFTLHQKMLAAGALPETESFYDDSQYAAVIEAGFTPAPDLFGRGEVFTTFDVSKMLDDGVVPLTVVRVLLGEQVVPTQFDGLGSWDWVYVTQDRGAAAVADFKAAYEVACKVEVSA